MSNINEFKAQLRGGGARPNLFKASVVFPPGIAGPNIENLGSFMIKGASLPASVINPIEVPYRGRKLKVAGDRTFEPWTITVINDNNMRLRNAFEEWANRINDNIDNTSAYRAMEYYATAYVDQLDRRGLPVKTYMFHGAFPTNISAIDLNYETNDTIEEFTVELSYQYWTNVEVGGR
jgi:hypothetical protein